MTVDDQTQSILEVLVMHLTVMAVEEPNVIVDNIIVTVLTGT